MTSSLTYSSLTLGTSQVSESKEPQVEVTRVHYTNDWLPQSVYSLPSSDSEDYDRKLFMRPASMSYISHAPEHPMRHRSDSAPSIMMRPRALVIPQNNHPKIIPFSARVLKKARERKDTRVLPYNLQPPSQFLWDQAPPQHLRKVAKNPWKPAHALKRPYRGSNPMNMYVVREMEDKYWMREYDYEEDFEYECELIQITEEDSRTVLPQTLRRGKHFHNKMATKRQNVANQKLQESVSKKEWILISGGGGGVHRNRHRHSSYDRRQKKRLVRRSRKELSQPLRKIKGPIAFLDLQDDHYEDISDADDEDELFEADSLVSEGSSNITDEGTDDDMPELEEAPTDLLNSVRELSSILSTLRLLDQIETCTPQQRHIILQIIAYPENTQLILTVAQHMGIPPPDFLVQHGPHGPGCECPHPSE